MTIFVNTIIALWLFIMLLAVLIWFDDLIDSAMDKAYDVYRRKVLRRS